VNGQRAGDHTARFWNRTRGDYALAGDEVQGSELVVVAPTAPIRETLAPISDGFRVQLLGHVSISIDVRSDSARWQIASTEREFEDQQDSERDRDRSGPRDREASREIPILNRAAQPVELRASCPRTREICTAVMAAIVTDGYISRCGQAA
jgi:hypothetical protein